MAWSREHRFTPELLCSFLNQLESAIQMIGADLIYPASTTSMPGTGGRTARLHAGGRTGKRTLSRTWLFVPLVYFAARGLFSFQAAGSQTGGFSPGTVQVRDAGVFGSVLLPCAVYLIVLYFIKSRWNVMKALLPGRKALVLLALLAPLSALWSQAPAKSLVFGTCYVIETMFAFYLVTAFEPEDLLVLLSRLLLLLCILNIMTVLLLPNVGLEVGDSRFTGAWRGIFEQRGGSARSIMYLLTASVAILPRLRTTVRTTAILLGLFVLAEAHAASAWIIFGAFCAFHGFAKVNRRLGLRSSTAVLLAASVAVGFLVLVLAFGEDVILPLIGRDPTLTGRTVIWSTLVDSILKKPLLGYGFHAFWLGLEGESGTIIHRLHWTFGYAHNGYLEITIQLGLIGLAVFLFTLLQGMRNAWICMRLDRSGRYEWHAGIILMTVIYNIDDCTVVWPKDLLSILYIVACCELSLTAARLQQRPALVPETT